MILTDSTRYTTYFSCPRKRYWNFEHGGTGIVPVGPPSESILYGSAFHAAACAIVKDHQPPQPELSEELAALLRGHLKCFVDIVLPSLRERFDFLGVEEELLLDLGEGVVWMTRPDLIVRSKESGLVYNLNYKTTSYPNDLLRQFSTSVQLMMEAATVSRHVGCHVTGSIVIAFDKGRVYEGVRRSPLVTAYMRGDIAGPEFSLEYKRGWTRINTWEFPQVLELVDYHKLYVELPPIVYSPEMVRDVSKQIAATERLIAREKWFPMNLSNCDHDGGYIGHVCPYKPLCWDEEPPEVGFEPRVPNHPIEGERDGA